MTPMRLFLCIAYLLAGSVCRGDGVYIGNGGGLSETQITLALTEMTELLNHCRFSQCAISPASNAALSQLLEQNLGIYRDQSLLEFLSGTEHPEIFGDPNLRDQAVFVTRPEPGAKIMINRDSLYSKTESGEDRPKTYAEGAALALDIISFQFFGTTWSTRELGENLATMIATRTLTLTWGKFDAVPLHRRPVLTFLNWPQQNNQLLLSHTGGVFDFADRLGQDLHCPAGSLLKDFYVSTMLWSKIRPFNLALYLKITYVCEGDTVTHSQKLRYQLDFDSPSMGLTGVL